VFSFLIRRLLQVIPTVFIAISFLFLLFFVLPGDPANLIAGGLERTPDPDVVARANERYGFNKPLWEQFVAYWGRVLRWDLGESFISGQSVNDILYEKAPRSIRLAIWATLIEITVGITVGLIAAVRRYSLTDKATTLATTAAAAIPVFVLGFILQYVFAVLPERYGLPDWMQLRTSRLGPDTWFLFFIPIGEQWRYLILPAVTLACVSTALAARMTRGSMLDVLNADYIRTARSKGLSERTVVLRHGLRNALIPVVTLIGIDFGTVIGAAVLTETVFSWPGIGSQIVDSVARRDLPVILGLSMVVVIIYSIVNLLVDLSYAWVDPRIRLGERVEP
jgi:ABC-type dipeptide/oligopeptide/nickel transport system permease component